MKSCVKYILLSAIAMPVTRAAAFIMPSHIYKAPHPASPRTPFSVRPTVINIKIFAKLFADYNPDSRLQSQLAKDITDGKLNISFDEIQKRISASSLSEQGKKDLLIILETLNAYFAGINRAAAISAATLLKENVAPEAMPEIQALAKATTDRRNQLIICLTLLVCAPPLEDVTNRFAEALQKFGASVSAADTANLMQGPRNSIWLVRTRDCAALNIIVDTINATIMNFNTSQPEPVNDNNLLDFIQNANNGSFISRLLQLFPPAAPPKALLIFNAARREHSAPDGPH